MLLLAALAAICRCVDTLASESLPQAHTAIPAMVPRSAVVLNAYLPGLVPAACEGASAVLPLPIPHHRTHTTHTERAWQQAPSGERQDGGEERSAEIADGQRAHTLLVGSSASSAWRRRRRQLQQLYLGPRVLDINSISW